MLRYRLARVTDPEERLEDAAMWKGLKDTFGDDVELYDEQTPLSDGDILLGRTRENEFKWPTQRLISPHLDYWNDKAFIEASGRSFKNVDFRGAEEEVKRLHDEGKGAFIKAMRSKYFIGKAPVGVSFLEAMDGMEYSFMDIGVCLMVQELVHMEYETRFAVMGREIVTSSPVSWSMTPLDTHRIDRNTLVRHPFESNLEQNEYLASKLMDFARETALKLSVEDCILDCAIVNGTPVAIELNPLLIGEFGLYAMDVHKISEGVRDILIPRLSSKNVMKM